MCGIFGIINNNKNLDKKEAKKLADCLFKLSESRGKEAAGIALAYDDKINIYKEPITASKFIQTSKYNDLFNKIDNKFSFIAHTRLATNGDDHINTQPVIKSGLVGVHNGIIVNVNKLWQDFPFLKREYEIDTEIFLALLRHYLEMDNLISAAQNVFNLIYGYASVGVLFDDLNCLFLATNNGSLYIAQNQDRNFFVFASEYYILEQFALKHKIINQQSIRHLKNNQAIIINLDSIKKRIEFYLADRTQENFLDIQNKKRKVIDLTVYKKSSQPFSKINNGFLKELEKVYEKKRESIKHLRRCTKCILPETMPFIEFDEQGVCNYCRNYKKIKLKGREELERKIAQYRGKGKVGRDYDSMIMFSGGRDSCFGLHYIKKVLKMNPVAYSYDWGMLTDLGRRNQSRLCAKLGVEHIIISADIRKKRENIRKNVLAWLKRPSLGTVPLFMAGDKQFFYYANKLQKTLGINLVFQCSNPYEKTDFKYGFSGVNISARRGSLTLKDKIKLFSYYAREYALNPAYLNSSLLDTIFAYFSYYFVPRNYLRLFDYVTWQEEEVNSVLVNEYDWELAPDTPTTWRIGDGTAAIYNYIYYMFAGFTENDTFRSNQIREGLLFREEAFKKIEAENYPRWQSIKWYCDIIGIDFEKMLRVM